MNEKEVREECVKLAELSGRLLREKTELEIIAHEQSVELFDLKKMVAGAQNKEELLLDHIFGMCEIIYYQCPLKEQDSWMDTMIEQGYYKKPED